MAGTKRTTTADTVKVTITDGTLVYFNGEQRGGTLTVPTALAEQWTRHGWATAA